MTEAKQQEAGRARFLLLPPLSVAERASSPLAICRPKMETPPVPRRRTVSPGTS